jgi:N-acetylmuramoyl-L-alanine amidase
VLAAFQMHYRPQKFDGEADLQSAAILQVLNLRH